MRCELGNALVIPTQPFAGLSVFENIGALLRGFQSLDREMTGAIVADGKFEFFAGIHMLEGRQRPQETLRAEFLGNLTSEFVASTLSDNLFGGQMIVIVKPLVFHASKRKFSILRSRYSTCCAPLAFKQCRIRDRPQQCFRPRQGRLGACNFWF